MSERIYFGNIKEAIEPPNLIEVQANSYVDFLQRDVPYSKRKNATKTVTCQIDDLRLVAGMWFALLAPG